ncbi:MAG: cyclic nucleotide-binding domain-containing protein [Chloroflexi bacterium]|nr:cyclic nucleotide-binding domain-containing protein [Chloroflexota bacterium]
MTTRITSALDRLSPAVHARLAELTRPVAYPAGAVILREGTDTPFLGAILEGRVALRLRVPERGDRVTIVTVEPGELLGWSAVVAPYRATVDAVATEPTRLLAIDAVALRDRLAADCELAAELLPLVLESVSDRLSGSWQQLLDMFGARVHEPW